MEELTAFLLLVSQQEFLVEHALEKSRALLRLEPSNATVRMYERLLLQLHHEGHEVFRFASGDSGESMSEDASSDDCSISESSETTLSPSDSDS